MYRFTARLGAMLVVASLLLGMARVAGAGTITVNDTADVYGGATCSLRNAVRSVNTGVVYGGCHFAASLGLRIVVPAGTFRITRPIDANDVYAGGGFSIGTVSVLIVGAGADQTVIDANGVDQALKLTGTGTFVTVSSLQLTGGSGMYGGAINDSGSGLSFTLDHALLQRSHASYGGGAMFVGDGIGTVTIMHSTFTDNDADNFGGGLHVFQVANMTIENTTISGNRALFVGGIEIYAGVASSSIRMNNVTIADNTSERSDISNSPLLEGGGGLYVGSNYLGTLHIGNSILAGNAAHYRSTGHFFNPDCEATIISDDYNVFAFDSYPPCTISGSTLHSYLNADPKLLSLFNYGGHVPTHAIAPDSPAHNNGNPATCASDDERGNSRSLDTCDIGAYEFHADFTVNSTLDANDAVADGNCDSAPPNHVCTLRAALDEANAATGARTIVVPAGLYTLTVPFGGGANHGELQVNNPDAVLILGAGADKTRIGWIPGRPSFAVQATPGFALAHLAIARAASTQSNGIDGSISISDSNALLEQISVTRARNCYGGAVDMRSTVPGAHELRVESSTFAYNSSYGCVVGANINSGGAISAQGANVYVRNSTISHNRADYSGGGIYATGSTVYLSQDTIADNVANAAGANLGSGGGIALDPGNGGSFAMAGTILARNTSGAGAPDDCAALLVSHDQNFIGNTSGCTIAGVFNYTYENADPQLGSLSLQGGATATQGLLATSPALNWTFDINCVDVFGNAITTDQRGALRSPFYDDQSTYCDIGAFEGTTDVIFSDGFE